ncbi:hypothetical protein HN51_058706 [Arachis hypogaea]
MEQTLREEDAANWVYRGEGAVNLVLAYNGSNPSFDNFERANGQIFNVENPDNEVSVKELVELMIQVATIAWLEADSVCGSHSVAIPLVLVLPYLFRLNQCLRQYKDTGEKTCLLNALKYSTAVPVIFLSALKYHVFLDKWTNFYRPLWLLSSVVNSSYSFYWDVNRDWDLTFA